MADYAKGDPDWDFAMKHSFDKSAAKVVMVDFDGTLFPFGDLFDYDSEPERGAVEALKKLKKAGWTIKIFSSRFSQTWLTLRGQSLDEQKAYVARRLDSWFIPWDSMTSEKEPAEVYIDDRSVPYRGNWSEIASKLLGTHVHHWVPDGDVSLCHCGASVVRLEPEEWGVPPVFMAAWDDES